MRNEIIHFFQEYEVSDHPRDVTSRAPQKHDFEEFDDACKKRVAHPSAESNCTRQVGPSQPPKRQANPQQRMYDRWRMMREVAAETAAAKTAAKEIADGKSPSLEAILSKHSVEPSFATANSEPQINGNSNTIFSLESSNTSNVFIRNCSIDLYFVLDRIRIAHVPYAMSLALEKKKVLENAAKMEPKTAAQTAKTGPRVAHIPQTVSIQSTDRFEYIFFVCE